MTFVREGMEEKCERLISNHIDREDDEDLFLESVGQLERWSVIYAYMQLGKELPLGDITEMDVRDYIEVGIKDEWWNEHSVLAIDVARERIENGDTKVIG